MRRSLVATTVFLLGLSAPAFAGYRIASWIPPWDDNALTSTQNNADKMTESNPVWYTLDSNGNIIKTYNSENPTWRAAMAGTELLPSIQNYVDGSWNGTVVCNIVKDPVKRENHAEAITQLVVDKAYDGIDIDYESMESTCKDSYSEFVRVLAGKLHGINRKLSVTVHAKTSDSQNWKGPGAQDYAAIGAAADWVKLMVYDYHWDGSEAGPITPLWWLNDVVTYAESKIAGPKIIVGLPWYGYDWVGKNADSVSYQEAMDRAKQHNATITHDENGEATYKYPKNHIVYFQDAFAYDRKADEVVQKHSVGGFAHWCNGVEDPKIWERVESLKNGGAPPPPPPPVPADPSSLSASSASSSTVDLAWTDNASNEDGYRIERCTGTTADCDASSGNYSQIAQIGANSTSYTDTGLASSTTYSYRVRAYNSGGNSNYSNSDDATTQAPPPEPPAPPPADPSTLIPPGSVWRYLDNGSDQGTAWRAVSFSDGTWASGAAQLGYGDGDETTVVSYGPSSSNKYATTYFRYAFSISDPSSYSSLTLSLMRDDGAVVYLNGTEVFRSNMPSGTIGYQTWASGAVVPPGESTFFDTSVDPNLLLSGKNVVAVEVHQSDAGSSDISFDLKLTGQVITIPAPSNLSAVSVSQSQIDLTWTDNSSNESGFKIERCPGSGCTNFAQIATVGANVTSYSDTGLSANTTYRYRVRAYDATDNSNYSNTAEATTPAPPPPSAPTALVAIAISTTQIDLTWVDGSSNEDGFRIERCTGLACTNFAQIATVGANVTSYSDTGLSSSTTYTYRVAAYNSGGDSPYSNSASATTLTPPPPIGPQTFIPKGSSWRYLDNGSDQGSAWQGLSFNDGSWKVGAAQLGYGDGDEVTKVSYGPSSTNKYVTTYFRHSFEVTDPAAFQSVIVRLMRDDGAVVYLNGTEIWRSNMPSGTIGYRTYATTAIVPPEESTFFEKTVSATLLVPGTNVLAVEIHQSDAGSSDISFDSELIAE